jgi:hypothetical protein
MTISTTKLDQLGPFFSGAVTRAVRETAEQCATEMKVSMTGIGGGIAYPRAGGSVHHASAPGKPPAIDSGGLVNSIGVVHVSGRRSDVVVGAAHGIYLELGTEHIAARPFVTPALEHLAPLFVTRVEQILSDAGLGP